MKLPPLLTEKSLEDAKKGKYTFWVEPSMTKYQIREHVGKTFGVQVLKVRTAALEVRKKKGATRRRKIAKSYKKAVVTLSGKEKIDLFEEGK